MRAILFGSIAAFRYVPLKDNNRVGQIDLIQSGDKRYPTKIVPIYIASSPYCRLILEHLEAYREPLITLLVWIKEGKEIEIEVVEMLSLTAEEVHPVNGRNDFDPEPNAGGNDYGGDD